MEPFALIAVGAALTGVAVYAVIRYLSEDATTRRELAAVPARKIAEVQDGMVVRVTGRLRPAGDLVQAPLTGRPCAYYLAVVEERQSSGKTTHWVEILRESHADDFEVEDGTGVALVRTDECKVAVTRDAYARSGTFDDATEAERALLARNGQETTGLLGFNRPLRYEEGVLEPGEEITVLGRASFRDEPGGRRVLVLGPPPQGAVLISDDRKTVAQR